MKRTAKIKTDVLGWECTHTHSAKGDDYAHQLFFFKYEIETNGAKSITLPCDKNLFVLAATQIRTDCECKCVTELYDTVQPREFSFKFKTLNSKLNYIYRKAIAYFWRVDDVGRIIYLHYRP